MDKPLIIKCNLMYPAKVINELRKDIQKQVNEGLVILPPGFELAEVDVELLKDIKREMEFCEYESSNNRFVLDSGDVYRIIDKHISRLKGENK